MADITAWSSTEASNTAVNGNNCQAGMSPGLVDNCIRGIMACVAGTFSSLTAAMTNFYSGAAPLQLANGGTAGTTAATARTGLGLGTSSVLDETTAAQFRANTASKVLSTDKVWSAAAAVVLTPGASVALDLSAGLNFTLAMGGNYTLASFTNGKAGQSGVIEVTQDATGTRTLAYGAAYLKAGGTAPVLSTAINSKDLLFYQVLANGTQAYISLIKAIA